MKKIFLSILIFVFTFSMLLTSIGCKSELGEAVEEAVEEATEEAVEESAEEVTEEAAEEKEPVTIQFVTGENDPPSIDVFNEWAADFKELYPWITVEIQAGGEEVTNLVLTNLASGAPVDIFNPNINTVIQLIQEGLLLPLDSVVDSLGGRDLYRFESLLVDDATDQVFGIPYAEGGQVMWIRTDIFEEKGIPIPSKEGWTWEECYDAVKNSMTDTDGDGKTDIYGIGLPYGQNSATDYFLTEIMWSNGIDFFDKENKLVVDSPYTVDAFNFYASLYEFAPPGALEYSWYETIDAFSSGSTAVGFYEGRILSRIYADNPELKGKFTAVPICHNKDFRNVTFGSPNYLAISNTSEHPEECLMFMEFVNKPENMAKFLATVPGHLVPETDEVEEILLGMNVPEIADNLDVIDVLWNTFEYSFNVNKDTGGLNREAKTIEKTGVLNKYFHLVMAKSYPSVTLQKIILEGADTATAIKDMAAALQADIDAFEAEQQ